MDLSENERQVYDFIRKRIDEGYPPTVREICSQLGFRSTSTAHRYIASLTRTGLIEKGGVVTAGTPITAVEDITDYISFQPPKNYPGELFALKVTGESMINAAILDGDIVIVEKTPYAENGEIVVAMVDNSDATVKRFFKEDGHFRLQPENDTMQPIIVDDVEIIGKVIAVMRYLK